MAHLDNKESYRSYGLSYSLWSLVKPRVTTLAWLNVIRVGVGQWFIKFAGLFVVPFLDDEARVEHPLYGARDATDLSYWNIAVRNGAHNYQTKKAVRYSQKGNVPRVRKGVRDPMEEKGFKWRYRKSLDGKYVSFRMTFLNARPKGKRELYIGWTMDVNSAIFSITFFQLRLFR